MQICLIGIQTYVWVMKEEIVILYIDFKWRVGVHFRQNTAKSTRSVTKIIATSFENQMW